MKKVSGVRFQVSRARCQVLGVRFQRSSISLVRRLLVVLRAYFDESGLEGDSKAFVLAGYVGTADDCYTKFRTALAWL